MPMPIPAMKGKSAFLKLFVDNSKKDVAIKSWEFGPDVTKINDGVCGEDRDRLDVEVNFFTIMLTLYVIDAKIIATFISDQAAMDTGLQPTEKAVGGVLKPQDGSKFGFAMKECTIDDWKLACAGRTDRSLITLPMRARYLDQVSL